MKEVTINGVITILNACLDDFQITQKQMNEDLSTLGMDSMTFIKIVVLLEEKFECEIPDSKLMITEMNTAQKIFDTLKGLST